MVASQTESAPQQQQISVQAAVVVEDEEEEDEEYLVSDTNRVLLDANQMLIDLKNEIDRKTTLIDNNALLLEGLKGEVTRKTESLEQLRQSHKQAMFEKDKLVGIVIQGYRVI